MNPQEFNYTFRIERVSFPYLPNQSDVYRIRKRNIRRKFNWSLFKFEKIESWDEAPRVEDENEYTLWSDGSSTFMTLEFAEKSLENLRKCLLSQYKITEII